MNIPLRSLFCLAAMAVCAGHAGAAGNGTEAKPKPDPATAVVLAESLRVEVRQGRVLLHVTLQNRSAATIYVAKEIATEDELERGLFEVQDSGSGATVPYTGMLVKRAAFTPQDYVPIKPKGKRSNTIEISKSYVFEPGHRYIVRHRPSYLAVGGNPEQPSQLDSISVAFQR